MISTEVSRAFLGVSKNSRRLKFGSVGNVVVGWTCRSKGLAELVARSPIFDTLPLPSTNHTHVETWFQILGRGATTLFPSALTPAEEIRMPKSAR